MKKFLAILAIAGFVTACNNDSETTTTSDDTTTIMETAPMTSDTAAAGTSMDTAVTVTADTMTVR